MKYGVFTHVTRASDLFCRMQKIHDVSKILTNAVRIRAVTYVSHTVTRKLNNHIDTDVAGVFLHKSNKML